MGEEHSGQRAPVAASPATVAEHVPAPVLETPAPVALGAAIVQAKLAVGPVGDRFEREADDTAQRVVQLLRQPAAIPPPGAAMRRVQRSAAMAAPPVEPTDWSGPTRVLERSPMLAAGLAHAGLTAAPKVRRLAHSRPQETTAATRVLHRRIQRFDSGPIGLDGGDVDRDTERLLDSARGGGTPLPDDVRAPMERAFGADFGSIRVHTGPTAADLNDRIQAKAFTTGRDIFFRDGLPDTSTSSGQNLLAHELTHTIQQGAQVQRSASIMRTWWALGRKKPSDPPEVTGPETTDPNGPETQARLAAMGYTNVSVAGPQHADPGAGGPAGTPQEPELQPEPPAPLPVDPEVQAQLAAMGYSDIRAAGPQNERPATPEYSGRAAQEADAYTEAAKPGGVLAGAAVAGGTAAATMKTGGGGSGGIGGALEMGGGSAVAGGVLGFAGVADAAMGLYGANALDNEAQQYGDAAMSKQAKLAAKDSGTNLAVGAANTGRGVASTVDIAQGGARAVAEGAAPAAAGVAAGVLGVAAGSAMVVQGTWRGGKAVVKLFRLTHGSGETMLSPEGERWKQILVGVEQFKVAINALKVAAGALGVAAGALMIVGSPVGWCVGLAAAIVGGAYAGSKLIARINNARKKMNAHAAAAGLPMIGEPTDVTRNVGGEQQPVDLGAMGYDGSQVIPAGPQNERDTGSGMTKERTVEDAPDDSAARAEAIEEADRIATMASANARTAAELRAALGSGDSEYVFSMVEAIMGSPDIELGDVITEPADRRLFDAFSLLSAINVDPEEALADSGQLLIEQRLSKAEAM